jgi:hypothetical protein
MQLDATVVDLVAVPLACESNFLILLVDENAIFRVQEVLLSLSLLDQSLDSKRARFE